MLHRALRAAVFAMSLPVLLAAGIADPANAATVETDDLMIGFEDIESHALAMSPRLKILTQELAAVSAGRREALKWSNPAVAYDHEGTGSFSEWQVSLQKNFSRPFSRGDLSDGWDSLIKAEELRGVQATRDHLAELKAGYLLLRLGEDHLGRLDRLSALVDLAAGVAGRRHAEGELSGLDRQLIQLTTYTLEAAEHQVRNALRSEFAAWRTEMGIPASRQVRLTTAVGIHLIDLESLNGFQDQLASTPGSQAQVALAQSLGKQANAARPGLLPGFDIYGGYKRFDPDLDGFVAGIAIELPIFNQSAEEAERLDAERQIVESELSADLAQRRGEVAALVVSLREAQPLLADFEDRLDQTSLTDILLLSYREGAITLDELLGAIQIEAAALDIHHGTLASYYQNIFRLEALTGAKLVQLAP
jgi:hypothetical protein